MSSSLKFSDGRALEYIDNGVSSKSALIFHHGTPGVMGVWNTWLTAAAEQSTRAIAFTRPGYASSDRKTGRTVIEANDDLEELLNQLEVDNFVSVGWSGGGPYAMASGLLERCTAVHLIASVSPFDVKDFDWFQDQSSQSVEEAKISSENLEASISYKENYYTEIRDLTTEQVLSFQIKRATFKSFENDYIAFAEDVRIGLRDALTPSVVGFAEDEFAFLTNWGFDVQGIQVPVGIWQGLDDESVSPHMAKWLNENIFNSTLKLFESQNHASIMVEKRKEILNAASRALKPYDSRGGFA